MKSLKIWLINLLGASVFMIGLLNMLGMMPLELFDRLNSPLANFALIMIGGILITLSDYMSPDDSYEEYMTYFTDFLKVR